MILTKINKLNLLRYGAEVVEVKKLGLLEYAKYT
jgi:hypothetical protein